MKLLYCHDNFYTRTDDAIVYSAGQFAYSYWRPFLEAFGEVRVVGRYFEPGPAATYKRMNISSGPRVSFEFMPNINTPTGLVRHGLKVRRELERLIAEADAVIVRAVSDIGWMAFGIARRMGKPVAMEMAACPWDSTWHHGSAYGRVYAPIRYLRDRHATAHADYVLYVSKEFLPNRYPTDAEVAFASNVRIDEPDDSILEKRLARIKRIREGDLPHVIGLIGALGNKLKGVHVALEAIALLKKNNPSVKFSFRHLGTGNSEPYKELARNLGIEDLVRFDGMVPSGAAVMDWLDGVDIYIQPSFQEGVPRATVEAMSRACPAIGSTAGGIPELLLPQWLHKPGSAEDLARLLEAMIVNTQSQIELAGRNFVISKEFTEDKLMPVRINFWKSFAHFAEQIKTMPDNPLLHKRPLLRRVVPLW